MFLLVTATARECFQNWEISKSINLTRLGKALITDNDTMALRTALYPSKTTALRRSLILDLNP